MSGGLLCGIALILVVCLVLLVIFGQILTGRRRD